MAKVRKDVDKAKADEETLLERLNEETKVRRIVGTAAVGGTPV